MRIEKGQNLSFNYFILNEATQKNTNFYLEKIKTEDGKKITEEEAYKLIGRKIKVWELEVNRLGEFNRSAVALVVLSAIFFGFTIPISALVTWFVIEALYQAYGMPTECLQKLVIEHEKKTKEQILK